MRPNTTRVCRVLRRVGFRCVHAATSLVLASPSTSSARRARRCTGPRFSDGLAGLARRLGWPCHFMTACVVRLTSFQIVLQGWVHSARLYSSSLPLQVEYG